MKVSAKRLVRSVIHRIMRRRRQKYLRSLYHTHRLNYYEHATVLGFEVASGGVVSVIVPCFNTPAKYLEPLLSSVFAQGYENWELILVDASSDENKSIYIKKRSEADTRIRYVRTTNEGIASNTNKGINLAKGEYIAFLDHDDTLDPDALAESVAVLSTYPEYGLVYSDEDKISEDGERYFGPHYKPGFSLDMLRNLNYITHFVVVRKKIVDKLEGIRLGFDGAQDYDFLLRVVDEGVRIAHVPKILYHWREAENSTAADFSSKKNVLEAGCTALDDHYARNGIKNVSNYAIQGRPGWYAPKYTLTKKKRAIMIDLSNSGLNEEEQEYIFGKYSEIPVIKENDIAIETARYNPESYDTVMYVSTPTVPIRGCEEIISMFGLAEEPGVKAVTPMLTKHGRVYSAGTINVDGSQKVLFANLAPDRNDFFGSIEWVRDVDSIEGSVVVRKTKRHKDDTRSVVWMHTEFNVYDVNTKSKKVRTKQELEALYSPNIDEVVNITQRATDRIVDELEMQ